MKIEAKIELEASALFDKSGRSPPNNDLFPWIICWADVAGGVAVVVVGLVFVGMMVVGVGAAVAAVAETVVVGALLSNKDPAFGVLVTPKRLD